MTDNNLLRRTILVANLLTDLKGIYLELKEASLEIEKHSSDFYKDLFCETKNTIQLEIDKYKANIQEMKQLNCAVIETTNAWYDFIKDEKEIKKVTFPIKLYLKKRAFQNNIKKMNQNLLDISIENRFIREKITIWEQELELTAIKQIKVGSEYEHYEKLLKLKDEYISELKYLLPTIPELCPIEFELDHIDSLIEKLLKMAAA